ncbi:MULTISPECIES: hypothetical protein [Enterococcus]|uniref:Uncharacterized protein n=1 Tax=Enterococcus sulfureus ATCC 49903 TaxID=1140003 RepID=S0PC50_9ENTE|nr:hypothetical protein [Enterococcus sulfureus]EOT46642.1 hypothetical protein OMY_01791 [Enterococcus sulfureus ATCC 49903]EOT86046.1 hypothetical protein I573_00799 [Enterococcus sulfureus ATCC 49903]
MYHVSFVDLYSKKTIESKIDEVPRTGDTVELKEVDKFYAVRGVSRTINESEGKTLQIIIYVEHINHTYWKNSLSQG